MSITQVIFDSLLPLTTERGEKLQKNESNKQALTQLFEKVVKDTNEALRTGGYKQFDALVKNFGCQMSALEIMQMIQKGVDESDLIQLARFRILAIVNQNVMKGEMEIPFTNLDALKGHISKTAAEGLITGLQIEESKHAARYICDQADLLSHEETDRASLIQRLVRFEKKEREIISLPLFYNTEASLRRIRGILLLKGKTVNVAGPILGALPAKLFFKMPEEVLLSEEETAQLAPKDPIYVVEGFVKNPKLKELIVKVGLLRLILVSAASVKQFCGKDQDFGDPSVDEDLKTFKDEELIKSFEVDHVYCASALEEK